MEKTKESELINGIVYHSCAQCAKHILTGEQRLISVQYSCMRMCVFLACFQLLLICSRVSFCAYFLVVVVNLFVSTIAVDCLERHVSISVLIFYMLS